MRNTLNAFKAQQHAAEALHAKLTEVATLMATLQPQLDRLRVDQHLRETFDAESKWLVHVQALVKDVRAFREAEFRRFRFGAVWRWAMACLFALAAISVAEAAHVWAEKPYAEEVERLRAQVAFADVVQQRMSTMTPSERLQFEQLLKLSEQPRRGRSR
jgi:hypothetical protein